MKSVKKVILLLVVIILSSVISFVISACNKDVENDALDTAKDEYIEIEKTMDDNQPLTEEKDAFTKLCLFVDSHAIAKDIFGSKLIINENVYAFHTHYDTLIFCFTDNIDENVIKLEFEVSRESNRYIKEVVSSMQNNDGQLLISISYELKDFILNDIDNVYDVVGVNRDTLYESFLSENKIILYDLFRVLDDYLQKELSISIYDF